MTATARSSDATEFGVGDPHAARQISNTNGKQFERSLTADSVAGGFGMNCD